MLGFYNLDLETFYVITSIGLNFEGDYMASVS